MPGMSDQDFDVTSSITRSLHQVANECDYLANGYRADGDQDAADYMNTAGRRYRQLIAAAPTAWAGADHADSLRAPAAAEADAETLWCPTPASEGVPRVH